jgi:CheY-like chemotaxis protein
VRVLVVEDAADTREMYRHFFGYHGMEVTAAPDGLIALQCVSARPPDVIVLDLAMPGMTGWEVIRSLKARARTRAIPILAVSGVGTSQSALAAGADGFLEKPCLPERLLAEVLRVVRRAADSVGT